jgi:hypothetical protein
MASTATETHPLPRPVPLRFVRIAAASIALHVVAIGLLIFVESRWIARCFPSGPSIPVTLMPRPETLAPEVEVPVVEPTIPWAPEPPKRPPRVEAPRAPREAPVPTELPPVKLAPPAAPAPPAGVSPWWSRRGSTVSLVEAYRLGVVAPDTTWLTIPSPEAVSRDTSFSRMNDAFRDLVPEILWEKFREEYIKSFPYMQ